MGCVKIAKATPRYCTCVVLLSENVRKIYLYDEKNLPPLLFAGLRHCSSHSSADACGGGKAEADKSSSQNGKIQITFYLWDRSMMKELTPWLEEKFPEYEFHFIQASTPWTTTAIC